MVVASSRGVGAAPCAGAKELCGKVGTPKHTPFSRHNSSHTSSIVDHVFVCSGGTKVDSFIYSPLIPESLRGTNYTGLMHVTDWLPTIVELTGSEYSPSSSNALDGVSQVDAWEKGVDYNSRSYMLYNYYYDIYDEDLSMWTSAPLAIRNSRYKLIHAYTGSLYDEYYNYDTARDGDDDLVDATCGQDDALKGTYTFMLYDLDADPYETTNLYNDSDYETIQVMLLHSLASDLLVSQTK